MSAQNAQPYTFEEIQSMAESLKAQTSHKPTVGIICGSGLGGLADEVEESEVVDYGNIPKFPVSTVVGHAGKFVFGKLGGKTVVCMKGRFHFYEGYPMWKVTLPVRVLKLLGIDTLVVTNAAGGLNPDFTPGEIMSIKDHIFLPGMAGLNPLWGPNMAEFGTRFPAMSGAYDPHLRTLVKEVAKDLNLEKCLKEGVYCMVSGPTYESPAEASFLRQIGGDAVGMSTAPEVVVARHCGLRVVGISLVTNKVVMPDDPEGGAGVNHEEVLKIGKQRAADMQRLVKQLVARF
eukprot:m.307348 g.307348  ORF g.307348 m.307348 type:complete len:289 (+) comp42176_c0_seq1:326-1192(+)